MKITRGFIRTLFIVLSVLLTTAYLVGTETEFAPHVVVIGALVAGVYACGLIVAEVLMRRVNLRTFTTVMAGLFVGYLMGTALALIVQAVIDITTGGVDTLYFDVLKLAAFLLGTYLGAMLTLRASDEVQLSIPFIRLASGNKHLRPLLLDESILADPRLLDFANLGLVDRRLVLPRFILNEVHAQIEIGDELTKCKARKSLEIVRKLQQAPQVGLRIDDVDFPELSDPSVKLNRLARQVEGDVLTADHQKNGSIELGETRWINIHAISNALKPLREAGEFLDIKIQRYGKEPHQGVGYLDDGTMVVINGGGDYLGEEVRARVLSVKHTASGRMIFCNLYE